VPQLKQKLRNILGLFFFLNSQFYLIDDLKQKIETKVPVKKVGTCFYYLK
jgi:hypothetical protein